MLINFKLLSLLLSKCDSLKEVLSPLINAKVAVYVPCQFPIILFFTYRLSSLSFLFSLSVISSLLEHKNMLTYLSYLKETLS